MLLGKLFIVILNLLGFILSNYSWYWLKGAKLAVADGKAVKFYNRRYSAKILILFLVRLTFIMFK
jgi:hypothetical protein